MDRSLLVEDLLLLGLEEEEVHSLLGMLVQGLSKPMPGASLSSGEYSTSELPPSLFESLG